VGDNLIPKFVPTHGQINILTSLADANEQFKLISNEIIVFGGMWGGGEFTLLLIFYNFIVYERSVAVFDTISIICFLLFTRY